MKLLLASLLALAGCSTTLDPHKPRTIDAEGESGEVTLKHGQRLHVPLSAQSGYEWKVVEPRVPAVVAEGPPAAEGLYFTPVRSGTEKLRIERRRARAEGAPEQVLTYDITVR
jgi:hypothetical protein